MMRKLVLLAIFAVGVFFTSNAQFKIGANLNVGIPTGDLNDAVGIGVGGTVTGLYEFSNSFAAGVQIGYISFAEKDNSGITFSVIPITAVGKYYFSESNFKPYISADLGLYSMKAKASMLMSAYDISVSATKTNFGVAPALGFEYLLSEKLLLDANAKYTNIFTEDSPTSYLGINVGFVYKF
ncbi:OmpW family outer membrane protein [Paludibacter jiangxiensis]|nr:OmpW family outer membrane protein [Paludibacter jiangxiensis]